MHAVSRHQWSHGAQSGWGCVAPPVPGRRLPRRFPSKRPPDGRCDQIFPQYRQPAVNLVMT
ncbi:putative lipoprotein [Bordetella bronchiseptica 99-R-0433]|nr:putative lipoprotein [Bordetella bronchiseptica 99-R-0433]